MKIFIDGSRYLIESHKDFLKKSQKKHLEKLVEQCQKHWCATLDGLSEGMPQGVMDGK